MRRKVSLGLFLFFASLTFAADDVPLPSRDDVIDRGGTDTVRSVAIAGSAAITAGLSTTADGGLDFYVSAYDPDTGQVHWEDHTPGALVAITDVYVVSDDATAYAVGYVPAVNNSSDILVRAYDVATGTVLWTHVWDAGVSDLPKAVVLKDGRLSVGGYGGDQPGEFLKGIVRTLDAATGNEVWTDIISTSPIIDAAVWGLAADDKSIYVACSNNVGSRRAMLLRSYDAASGALNWEVQRSLTSVASVATDGARVYVSGLQSSTRSFLAAYGTDGTLAWAMPMATQSNLNALTITSSAVIAAGKSGTGLWVTAMDPATGQPLWQSKSTPAFGITDNIRRVAATDKAVYVVGQSNIGTTESELLMRVYDPAGNLISEERTQRTRKSAYMDMSVRAASARMVAVGDVTGATTDAIAKAVDVTSVEKAAP